MICNVLLGLMRDAGADWTFGWSGFFGFLINQTFAMLGGFALACLLLNTPAAIVAFFAYRYVLPDAARDRLGADGVVLPRRTVDRLPVRVRPSSTTCR